MATCVRGVFTVQGAIRSVNIGPGWHGDLDQVVGEEIETPEQKDEAGKVIAKATWRKLTLGAALGEAHVAAHFEVVGEPAKAPSSKAPVAPREE